MTPERALEYARRIVAMIGRPHSMHAERDCVSCDIMAEYALPILQEAIAESVEDHMVSVLAASKGGQA